MPPRLATERQRQRVPSLRHVGLERMCEGIDSGERGYSRRLRNRQFWIENRGTEGGSLVAASHLHMCRRIRDESVGLCFTTSAGGSRHRDHWQQRPIGFSFTPIILHAATAGVEKVDS